MNPEFQRQLWLQFSPTRLALLPVLLAACFAAVGLTVTTATADALAVVGAVLFGVLVWGMGTLAAGTSVVDEITERTWDQQRMSAMQPWAMTWGKLAGATAYGWYGGALCLLVAVPSAMLSEQRELVLRLTVGGVLLGVLLQAVLISVNLQLVKVGGGLARRGGMWMLLLVALWGLGPLLGIVKGPEVMWWSQGFNRAGFAVASLAFFTACALVAAWRSMAEVLAVRQLPWGWPALALVATAYMTGFAPSHVLPVFSVIGLMTCVVLTYLALLTEPQPRPLWQRVLTRLNTGQWRAALQQLPRWPTTLMLSLPFAVLAVLTLTRSAPSAWPLHAGFSLQAASVVVVLLMTRDCALALFLAFSPKGRRPVLGFLVLMLVLYGLLPGLLGALRIDGLSGWAQPLLVTGPQSVVYAALHAAVALGLLRWRWRATAP